MIDTLTRVACVVVFVMEMPLKSGPSDFVLMAVPNRDRTAFELKYEGRHIIIRPSTMRIKTVKAAPYNTIFQDDICYCKL